jgi:hypothetical protein
VSSVDRVAAFEEQRAGRLDHCSTSEPRDHRLQGDTADAIIKAQDRHLRDTVAGGDDTHASALKAMKGRWKHPISGIGWYRAAKRDFAALPED